MRIKAFVYILFLTSICLATNPEAWIISPLPSTFSINSGSPQTFTVGLSDADGNLATFDWIINGTFDTTVTISGAAAEVSRTYTFTDDNGGTSYVEGFACDTENECSMDEIVWIVFVDQPTSQEDYHLPEQLKLKQNSPNPFNPSTSISYDLPQADYIEISMFNIYGQHVESIVAEEQSAGVHTMTWHPNSLDSGVYIYTLKVSGRVVDSKKAIYLK